MLSYFGTDQSQVQRYLTARSVEEARSSLLMSAYWKIPLQALILLIGVLIFVFYLFRPAPLLFNPAHERSVRAADPAGYAILEERYRTGFETRLRRGDCAGRGARGRRDRRTRVPRCGLDRERSAHRSAGDGHDRHGRVIARRELRDAELRAQSPAARHGGHLHRRGDGGGDVVDCRRAQFAFDGDGHRFLPDGGTGRKASDAHYLMVSKVATGFWGLFACFVAIQAGSLGSLIEVVNRFGSFFYGSILGVFLLAMIPRARALGAFVGLDRRNVDCRRRSRSSRRRSRSSGTTSLER